MFCISNKGMVYNNSSNQAASVDINKAGSLYQKHKYTNEMKFCKGDKFKFTINRVAKNCSVEKNGKDYGVVFSAEEFANIQFYPGVTLGQNS